MCPIIRGVVVRSIEWVCVDVCDGWYGARHHTWPTNGPEMATKWPKMTAKWPQNGPKTLIRVQIFISKSSKNDASSNRMAIRIIVRSIFEI